MLSRLTVIGLGGAGVGDSGSAKGGGGQIVGTGVCGKAGQGGLGFEQGRDLGEEGSSLSHAAECQMACLCLAFVFQQCQHFSSCI